MKIYRELVFILFIVLLLPSISFSQFDLLDKVKDKVDKKVEEKTDQTIDNTLDKIENEVEGNPESKEQTEGQKTEVKQEKPVQEKTPEIQTSKPKSEELKSMSKFDFIPGENVIFYDDFTQDQIGEFPALWWTNTGGEVKTVNLSGGKWFQMKGSGLFMPEKGIKMPENFTVEFDVIPVSTGENPDLVNFGMTILSREPEDPLPTFGVPGKGGVSLGFSTIGGEHSYAGYSKSENTVSGSYTKEKGLLKVNEINHISIWVQQPRFRLYIHGEKVFDVPKAIVTGIQLDQIRFSTGDYDVPMISNLRIAEAGADMRSKLLTEGKLIVHGINFDVNSDKIKASSYPVLKEIATILKANPNIKVKIVGHTDSDGDEKANLDLSKKRAVSVKNALTKEFEINAAQLETDGKGELQPIDKNATPLGKANNRRVEFIKI